MDADLIELLTQNISRFDEGSDADRAGVYYVLGELPFLSPTNFTKFLIQWKGVLENLASQTTIAEKIGQESSMLPWLVSRIQLKESPVSQNKQYSAEILAILLQSSTKNKTKFVDIEGVDVLLQLLSQYRKRDPAKDSDEEEYVENLFDCLICLVDEDAGKNKFLDGEGVELSQIMLKEGKFSKQRALRVLDHALGGFGGAPACDRLVEVAGLKTVFGMFMKKVCSVLAWRLGLNVNAEQQENQTIERLLGIFASLLRLLPGGSAARIRTLAKFMEKDYEKIDKLVKLRRDYLARVSPVEQAIEQEKNSFDAEEQEVMAPEWLSRRLDAGLFSIQVRLRVIFLIVCRN